MPDYLQGRRICINEQLRNHKNTVSKMVGILGNQDKATQQLNKCLYSVQVGSNDYLNNYFMPQHYNTSTQYTLEQYAGVLMEQFSRQMRILYGYGARKFALFGMAPIGCTPHAIKTYGTNGTLCVNKLNDAAQLFNDQLKLLIEQLRIELEDAKFVYVNMLGMIMQLPKHFPGTHISQTFNPLSYMTCL
ncbi:GDSL esterase/lipase At1g29660-like [Tripterygium wilfordii]|uniref:GDSL esterase/lipase At1g29660-like n=1 Tax=Tripterygium wilfordii TaxID=458696 RepID=UPI0018F8094B|nr:GDSL esterase/lipase At1g29660-like [Tripterygium wilfordii]